MINTKIAYKWVVQEEDNYYPLVNYGIDRGRRMNEPFYRLNGIYSNYKNIFQNSFASNSRLDFIPGYHFFLEAFPKVYNNHKYENLLARWEACLSRVCGKNIKITILECLVNETDILIEQDNRLIASKFKVLNKKF